MTDFEKKVSDIQNAYKNNQLIPFIGSGFSKPLGLPDWNQLIKKVALAIDFDPDLLLVHGSYPQILDYIHKKHHAEWTDFIHDLITSFDSQESNKKRALSKTHKALSDLLFKTIYTTNYDSHLEKSFQEAGKETIVLTDLEDFVNYPKNKNAIEIVKFHGDIKKRETMTLTETQYFNRMELEDAVDQKLRSDLLSNSFLFIGYSFNDPNIRYIWYKIHKLKNKPDRSNEFDLKKSYYITFGNEPIQSILLNAWGIEVLSLDPKDPNESLFNLLSILK